MSKKYPEAIYETRSGLTMTLKQRNGSSGKARRSAYDLGYDLGYEHGKRAQNDLTGWSNLTEAIKAGESIDWEQLDGMPARCVHPELGTLTGSLIRRKCFSEETANGWCEFEKNTVWEAALPSGWYGLQGWSLWVKGDLPLRKLTADELEPGTCFRGSHVSAVNPYIYTWAQLVQARGETKVVCFNGEITSVIAVCDPADVEVLEVYGVGTFSKPKADQA